MHWNISQQAAVMSFRREILTAKEQENQNKTHYKVTIDRAPLLQFLLARPHFALTYNEHTSFACCRVCFLTLVSYLRSNIGGLMFPAAQFVIFEVWFFQICNIGGLIFSGVRFIFGVWFFLRSDIRGPVFSGVYVEVGLWWIEEAIYRLYFVPPVSPKILELPQWPNFQTSLRSTSPIMICTGRYLNKKLNSINSTFITQ